MRYFVPLNNRPFFLIGWVQHSLDERDRLCDLYIRINGRQFIVALIKSNFVNSHSRLNELLNHMAVIRHDDDEEYDDEEVDSDDNSKDDKSWTDPADTDGWINWILGPCLDIFHSLAPPPTDITALTMADVYHPDAFECQLRAIDDQLVPGPVEKRQSKTQQMGELCDYLNNICHAPPSTAFPSFRLAEIQVVDEAWERKRDLQNVQCKRVRAGGQDLYFLRPHMPRNSQYETETYAKIAGIDFGPEVRVARLFGLVLDDEGNLFGYLVDLAGAGERLSAWHARGPEREKWMQQIETTVKALHENGIVWGDPQVHNVAIDDDGNALLVEFGHPYVSDWEKKKGLTAEKKDLKGVEKIRKFIMDGR